MKLIIGLGNPGKEYSKTRHSIGFTMLEDFVDSEKLGKFEYQSKWKAEILETTVNDEKVIFLKPMEFMNRSGGAVGMIANFYKIEPKDILVIHDEIDLPVGKIQMKVGGSSAGHNGLKSIIEKLGTKEFGRLRIGVDRPLNQADVADYVLDPFKDEEKNLIEDKAGEIEKYIKEFLGK